MLHWLSLHPFAHYSRYVTPADLTFICALLTMCYTGSIYIHLRITHVILNRLILHSFAHNSRYVTPADFTSFVHYSRYVTLADFTFLCALLMLCYTGWLTVICALLTLCYTGWLYIHLRITHAMLHRLTLHPFAHYSCYVSPADFTLICALLTLCYTVWFKIHLIFTHIMWHRPILHLILFAHYSQYGNTYDTLSTDKSCTYLLHGMSCIFINYGFDSADVFFRKWPHPLH
jgi:hypothetical protein